MIKDIMYDKLDLYYGLSYEILMGLFVIGIFFVVIIYDLIF